MSNSLLAPNATDQERALDLASARLGDIPVGINNLWNPDLCPSELLPWMAWALSVDEWQDNWSEEDKRKSLWQSFSVHVRKGTVASVRAVLEAAGYGDVAIIEGLDAELHDGTMDYDGIYYYGEPGLHWAMYRVFLHRPISIQQAAEVRRILAHTAPVRCHLAGLSYTEAMHLYDNSISYDGSFPHGVA